MKKLLVIESCSGCYKQRSGVCRHHTVGFRVLPLGWPTTIPDWCPLPDAAPSAREAGDPTINDDGISKDDLIGGNS